MLLGTRLKELREKYDVTQKEIADLLGVTPKAVSFYELDQRSPSLDMVVKLANRFNVTTDYLLDNEDRARISGCFNLDAENKKIPIIGSVRCGPNGLAFDYIDGYILVGDSFKGDVVGFRCKGDSMKDIGIGDGDLAVVRLQEDVECGELAVVVINGDEGTLKRVRKFDGGIILEAANPVYPPRVFQGEELQKVRIVGKVMEIRKKF